MNYEANQGYNAGEESIGREGWIKISEERFKNPRMNRKSSSDILERLVEAANVSLPRFTASDVSQWDSSTDVGCRMLVHL